VITLPYVTTASFKAYPTFLDVMNLRPGDPSLSDQDGELFNILLKSSAWVDNYTEMGAGDGTLSAHVRSENARVRVARDGRISYHPNHTPITALTGLSTGVSPNSLVPVADLANLWIEDNRQIVGFPGGQSAPTFGVLQFGNATAATELYCTWTYVAGYANTLLAAAASAGASSIQVQDATGIVKGSVLRIWDPGSEEAVTVASSYSGGTTLPLTPPLKNTHAATAPTGVSGLPADVHLATILYAAALLQRPDSDAEDTFPSTQVRPNARIGKTTDGSGFVMEAQHLLEPYRRVR
jgi:hypothetical protein